jgi:hypothetical protein
MDIINEYSLDKHNSTRNLVGGQVDAGTLDSPDINESAPSAVIKAA